MERFLLKLPHKHFKGVLFMKKFALSFLIGFFLIHSFAQSETKTAPKNHIKATLYVVESIADSKVSASFGVVENLSDEIITLNAVFSDISNATELHQSIKKADGTSQMQKVDSLQIPPKSSLQLKPNSFHIMFIGLRTPLKAGESTQLTLSTDKFNTTLQVPIIARKDLDKHLQNLGITDLADSHSQEHSHHH